MLKAGIFSHWKEKHARSRGYDVIINGILGGCTREAFDAWVRVRQERRSAAKVVRKMVFKDAAATVRFFFQVCTSECV